jgi:hypothetical protein
MGKRWIVAAALSLLSSMALAEHAVTLEPDAQVAAPAAASEQPAPESNVAAPTLPPAVAPESSATVATSAPEPAPQPAPQVQVNATYPAEVDVYLVPAAMREVCTTGEWGFDEIRTECRTEPIPVRRVDPALRGVCVTRYGQRTCY